MLKFNDALNKVLELENQISVETQKEKEMVLLKEGEMEEVKQMLIKIENEKACLLVAQAENMVPPLFTVSMFFPFLKSILSLRVK